MKKYVYILLVGLLILVAYILFQTENDDMNLQTTNDPNGMLLVLAAPSLDNEYYNEYFDEIMNFQIEYAKKVQAPDTARILVDAITKKEYEKNISSNFLIDAEVYDIWMRDFSTVNPEAPVQFVYTDASMSKSESVATQKSFNRFAKKQNIEFENTKYILDGGNIVDNYNGKVITTHRFLEDNNLTYDKGKKLLKELLDANEVAILEPDDEVLAHSDGMVSWIDDNTLLVNDYSDIDPKLNQSILSELKASFPDIKIIPIPVEFQENAVDSEKGIGSACGIHINLVATYKNLYVPVFNTKNDETVLEIIRSNTTKKVIPISANTICKFGGSVRCTTWQISQKYLLDIY